MNQCGNIRCTVCHPFGALFVEQPEKFNLNWAVDSFIGPVNNPLFYQQQKAELGPHIFGTFKGVPVIRVPYNEDSEA